MKRVTGRPSCKSTAELVEGVQMNAVDRRVAMAALQRAEAIADVLYRATEAAKAAIEAGLRGARILAQRIRTMLAKPTQS
jgi:hypothetical protein